MEKESNKKWIIIFCVISVLSSDCNGTKYFVTEGGGWDNSVSYCANYLQGTMLAFGTEFINFLGSCNINAAVWLGKEWVEDLGCNIALIANDAATATAAHKMLDCFNYCSVQRSFPIFSALQNQCRCYAQTTLTSNPSCTNQCPGNSQEFCGGFNSMSTYQKVNALTLSPGNCQSLQYSASTAYSLSPSSCSTSYSFVCNVPSAVDTDECNHIRLDKTTTESVTTSTQPTTESTTTKQTTASTTTEPTTKMTTTETTTQITTTEPTTKMTTTETTTQITTTEPTTKMTTTETTTQITTTEPTTKMTTTELTTKISTTEPTTKMTTTKPTTKMTTSERTTQLPTTVPTTKSTTTEQTTKSSTTEHSTKMPTTTPSTKISTTESIIDITTTEPITTTKEGETKRTTTEETETTSTGPTNEMTTRQSKEITTVIQPVAQIASNDWITFVVLGIVAFLLGSLAIAFFAIRKIRRKRRTYFSPVDSAPDSQVTATLKETNI